MKNNRDAEVVLNVLAHERQKESAGVNMNTEDIGEAVRGGEKRGRGE